MSNQTKNILLALCAIIWGSAFVAQSVASNYMGAFSFNASRFIVGSIALIPFVYVSINKKKKEVNKEEYSKYIKTSIKAGCIVGFFQLLASTCQQLGITYSSASKAGFITALYIVLVPIISIALYKKKVSKNVWIAVIIAIVGFYFLSIKGDFTIEFSDLLLLLCALFYSFQILSIDKYAPSSDAFLLTQFQFIFAGVVSLIVSLFVDIESYKNIGNALLPILYAGVFSCCIAYSLQVIGQKDNNPTIASIIMSLESVFSCFFGVLLLSETLTGREILGCVLIFSAVIISQLPSKTKL